MAELSVLEKALSKTDFAAERGPLDQILRALKPLRLKSLEDLDLNTRGKLITTLARVMRQPKPPPSEAPAAEPPTTSEAPAVEAPASEPDASESSEAPSLEASAPDAADAAAPEASAESPEGGAKAAAPVAPPVEDKSKSYADVLYRVGLIWNVLGEKDRSETALQASGRTLDPKDLEKAEQSSAPPREAREGRPGREGRDSRDPRGRRDERGPRPERGARPERPARPERERESPLVVPEGMDWAEHAKGLESRGRTRDAGRLYEQHGNHAEAARLFEAGGDIKSAVKSALAAGDNEGTKRMLATLKPEESQAVLEKLQAYELLMELYVQQGQFEKVAGLYERARQFDQAALAWERSGKLGPARKAYERARDFKAVDRLRALEVSKLVERGDRLGAAVLLLQGGKRIDATELLKPLPAPKQYRFLEKLKLDEEAKALAQAELAKADQENRPSARARWLEMLNDVRGAAEAWEKADRKDKAYPHYEALGEVAKAAALAEAAGHRDPAIALYKKAGDEASVARVEAMPPPAPSSQLQAPDVEAADELETEPGPSPEAQ